MRIPFASVMVIFNLVACSDHDEAARLRTENIKLAERNAALSRKVEQLTSEAERNAALSRKVEQLTSEFESLYTGNASVMLARAQQLKELGRSRQATDLFHELVTAFPESKEATIAKRTAKELQTLMEQHKLQEDVATYFSSMKKVFGRKLAGSSGGSVTEIQIRESDLEIAVTHSDCEGYGSVLLDFAIVCDRGENWNVVKRNLARVVLAFSCGGMTKRYYVPAGTVAQYHSTTMSDFAFLDAIRPL